MISLGDDDDGTDVGDDGAVASTSADVPSSSVGVTASTLASTNISTTPATTVGDVQAQIDDLVRGI